MNDTITISQVKEKVNQAELAIASIINKLQEDTTISVKGITFYLNQVEVARNEEIKLKLEYDL